jgi:hypothetical protein
VKDGDHGLMREGEGDYASVVFLVLLTATVFSLRGKS